MCSPTVACAACPGDKDAVSSLRPHDVNTVTEGTTHAQAYAVDVPDSQEGLRRQMDIFHPYGSGATTRLSRVASPPSNKPRAHPQDAVLNKEDTGLELAIAASEPGRDSSNPEGVGSDEIFRIGGEVVLLTAAQAKVANLLKE
jgi:hypothetical protein